MRNLLSPQFIEYLCKVSHRFVLLPRQHDCYDHSDPLLNSPGQRNRPRILPRTAPKDEEVEHALEETEAMGYVQ